MKSDSRARAVVAAGLVLAVVAAAGPGRAAGQEAESCRRVDLIERLTGNSISGVEDIEIDTINGMAIASAHDRWALEDAHGVKALGVTVAELVDKNPEIDISAVYFVECGLHAVHAELKAKWDALNEAKGRAEA